LVFRWERPLAPASLVCLAALTTYVATLGYDFSFDDRSVIPAGWQVGASSPLSVLQAPVRAGEVLLSYFRPLTALSYWLDGLLWQGNPGGFHLTNLLLHALASVLVLCLARRLLPAGPGPIVAALLFAVHPVHVEAVAWVQGRVDLLAAVGVLTAVLLAATGMELQGPPRLGYLTASAAAALLALLAKEVAAVAPVLAGVVVATSRREPGAVKARDLLPFAVLHGCTLLLYFGLRTMALGAPLPGLLDGPPIADRLLLALRVIPLYLRLLLFPLGLNPKHDVQPPAGLLDAGVLLGAFLLGLIALAVLCGRGVPGLVPGLLWLVLAWLPASNVLPIPGFVVAERYLYLPSVGYCIALVGVASHAVAAAPHRWRRAAAGGVAVVLIALAGATAYQGQSWRDTRAFYEHLVRVSPHSAFARNNLGSVYLESGEDARAEAEFREALRLHPGSPGPLNNLGLLAQRRGRTAEARGRYLEVLRTHPEHADAWNNLGTLYEAEGNLAQAAAAYGEAVRLAPLTPRFLANLAEVSAAQGRRGEAAGLLERAIALDPMVARWRASLARLRAGGTP
jgi:Flp pilus assembly protein TadD